eukprot:COSAG01_NODE_69439_length_261_cov_0.925926_1_plen_72_part_10
MRQQRCKKTADALSNAKKSDADNSRACFCTGRADKMSSVLAQRDTSEQEEVAELEATVRYRTEHLRRYELQL